MSIPTVLRSKIRLSEGSLKIRKLVNLRIPLSGFAPVAPWILTDYLEVIAV
jgi:hypothetical protein